MPGTSAVANIAQYIALAGKIAALIVLGFWGRTCFQKLGTSLDDRPPGVDTSWGGLGGSLGGWSMSKSLAWLLMTLLTLVLFAGLAFQLSDGLVPASPAKDEAKKTAESKTSAPASEVKQAPAATEPSTPAKNPPAGEPGGK